MKLILKNILLIGSVFFSLKDSMACTREEAESKMRALSQFTTERLYGASAEQQKAAFAARDTSMVGHLLAEKKYKEACTKYDEIAAKYQVDLALYQKKLAPVTDKAALAAGKCDLVAATKKVHGIYPKYKAKLEAQGKTGGKSPIVPRVFLQT